MTIDISESREHVREFLKNNSVGVLATASNMGKPHAATVYVTFDQDLNIYFLTRKGTRKSQNIHSNNQAALSIYNAASQTTLQAEGSVIEVSDTSKVQWVANDIWRIATQASPNSPPPQTQLIGAGDYAVYKLSAPSLRLATFKGQGAASPEQVFNIVPTQEESHFNAYDKNVN